MPRVNSCKFYGLILLIAVSSFSCNSPKVRDSKSIVVDYKGFEDVVIEESFSNISFVKLEDNDLVTVGNVGRVIVSDSSLFIESDDQISEFSLEGEFKRTLFEQGFGPAEYERIADFQIIDNTIVILDNTNSRLLFYRLEDFSFDHYVTLQFRGAASFEYLDDTFFFHKSNRLNPLLDGADKYELLTTNLDGDIMKGYFPYEYEVEAGVAENLIGLDRPFGRNGSSLMYSNGFRSDSIYTFSNRNLRSLSLVFPERPNLDDRLGKPLSQFTPGELLSMNSEIHLGPFFNFLTPYSQSFVILYENKFRWVYLKGGKVEFMSMRLISDQHEIEIMPPNNYSNEYFISVLNSSWLDSQRNTIENRSVDSELMNNAFRVLKDDLNPIIVLFKEQ